MQKVTVWILGFVIGVSAINVASVGAWEDEGSDVPACRADFDKNGVVNANDTAHAATFPATAQLEAWDLNGINGLDLNDLEIFNCLVEEEASWVVGDYTGDGEVTVVDLNPFLILWGSGDFCADLEPDGVIDQNDIAAFVELHAGN